MAPTALWFGPPDRPLFARLYLPVGQRARAAVVLCPPLGVEAQAAAAAFRALGQQLQEQGLAALYIDYDGTGDSAGSEGDPDRVAAWQGSVQAAVDLLRGAGAKHVSAIGMRLGATIAASVGARAGLDSLVLWDPCDGRSYLREQALMKSVYVSEEAVPVPPPADDGRVETLGTVYSADTATALSALNVESAPGPLAGRVLALLRPERPARPKLAQRLSEEAAQLGEASGQEALLSVWPLAGLVPEQTIATVTGWLAGLAPAEALPLQVSPVTTVRLTAADGAEVVEEVLSMGAGRLFGILTRPAGAALGPTTVLLNSGRLDHLGPGRLYVNLARHSAGLGLPVVRVDLAGLGDSPARPGQRPGVVYPAEAMEDISHIVAAVSPAGAPNVVLMGLCSGAYHAVEAATSMDLRGVVLLNPVAWERPPARLEGPASPQAASSAPGPAVGMGAPGPAGKLAKVRAAVVKTEAAARVRARRIPGYHRLIGPARRLLDAWWWWTNRRGGRVRGALVLKQVADRRVDVLVVCRPWEARRISRGDQGVLRRMVKRGGFRMEVLDGIDHTLFLQAARDKAVPVVVDHLLSLSAVPLANRPPAAPHPTAASPGSPRPTAGQPS